MEKQLKGDVRAEIAQLFKYKLLFQPFIILDLYLQHMESLTEIIGRQAISARTSPFPFYPKKSNIGPNSGHILKVSNLISIS